MAGSRRAPPPRKPAGAYHHGDLRAALLEAGEAELAEHGVEGFSLRGVAKRAGVSHAAPAHHFGDVNGLLTALAALAFQRFLDTKTAHQSRAPGDPVSQLVASGCGYIEFALENPALFRLMFASDRPDHADPALCAVSSMAYQRLIDDVSRTQAGRRSRGRTATTAATVEEATAIWALVHGLADLMIAGRVGSLATLRPADRAAAIRTLLTDTVKKMTG